MIEVERGTLERRPKTEMMSSVCKPTLTAAYKEYVVSLYSCICVGLKLNIQF